MKFILIFAYFLLIPLTVYSQFSSDTKIQADEIRNNTALDILLNPTSSVKVNNFSGGFALQSGSLKELEESAVTNTELGFVSGVTSSIQNQIDNKANDAEVVKLTGNQSISGVKTFTEQFLAVSTVNGFRPCPVMTNLQRDAIASPQEGDCVVSSDDNELNYYLGGNWGQVGGGVELTATGNLIGFSTVTEECVLDKTDGNLLTVDSGATCGFDFKAPPVSTTLDTKGQLQGYSTQNEAVPAPTSDGQFLVADDAETTGLKWSDQLQGKLNPIVDMKSFTPVWRGASSDPSIGNGVLFGRYGQQGDLMFGYINMASGSTTTFGSGDWYFEIPDGLDVKDILDRQAVGSVFFLDNSSSPQKVGVVRYSSFYDGLIFNAHDSATTSSSVPFTWEDGDDFTIEFTIPIQGWSSGLDAVVRNNLLDATSANELSAKIDSSGNVTSENYDWIAGTCSILGTARRCTFTSLGLSNAMSCHVHIQGQNATAASVSETIEASTTTYVDYSTSISGVGNNLFAVELSCSKQGSDVNKSQINAATLNNTILSGQPNFPDLPTYADDSAAGVGGLSQGDIYKTATGELRVKL